ncbi:MAG: hypothetical protein A2289_09025 [Deltaproteobacteria bacterium RIFOXYA12_FULL_58_15]|nr:MAG: hypothetical protein A2289_09025 [Deltaproteobacteria bacterium RIFOXYA12_FULL_58_15]OGR12865.1 MAG: hypothetical protein A2341_13315 [Deltaproteobacteria bacterium RIFOXYB12_FULL_58_9]
MIVIDASVALKWFFDGEPGRVRALLVLDAVRENPDGFAVPELFFAEMLAVLCRSLNAKSSRIQSHMGDLEALGLTRIGHGHELLETAVGFSVDWGLSGYDALYAATAHLLNGTWLTADKKAARRVRKAPLVQLLDSWPV